MTEYWIKNSEFWYQHEKELLENFDMRKKNKFPAQNKGQKQKELRKKRGEHAFIFDKKYSVCLGKVDREDWEFAISEYGGRVDKAAKRCGIPDIPKSGRALWGTSEEDARRIYNQWKKRSKK